MLRTLRIFGSLTGPGALGGCALILMTSCIFLNAANVSFQQGSQEILLPLGQGDFDLGNLDGDAYIDLLVTHQGIVTRYLNDGRGIFNNSQVIFESVQISQIELIDLDGDGDSDYWLSDNEGSTASWISNEDGSVVLREEREGLGLLAGTSFGDIDHDGDLDALVSIPMTSSISLETPASGFLTYLNRGDGSFAVGQFVAASVELAQTARLGDFDGDTDLDFVTVLSDQTLRLWTNDGEGSFSESDQVLQSVSAGVRHTIELGDFDGDGALDIIAPEEGGQNWLWLNDGQGRFETTPSEISQFLPILSSGDFDNDSDIDLVASGAGCTDCSGVWLQDGGGLTPNTVPIFSSNALVHQLEVVDVDADGDRDLIVLLDIGEAPASRTVVSTWLNSFIDLSIVPTTVGKIVDPTLSEVIRQLLGLPLDLAVSPDYSNLTRLELSRSDFGEFFNPIRSLEGLEEATNIEHLRIDGILEPDLETGLLDLTFLKTWGQLKSLSLKRNGIVHLILPAEWTELESIQLDENLLTDIGFINDYPKLHSVTLSHNRITRFTQREPTLGIRKIDLSGNPLDAVEIVAGVPDFLPRIADLRINAVEVNVIGRLAIHPTSNAETTELEFLGDVGNYAIRRSTDFVNWNVVGELSVESSNWPPVIFTDDTGSAGPTAFYSIARQSP